MSVKVGQAAEAPSFPKAARELLGNTQLRHNVRHATDVIRARRAHAVAETPDWQQLRDSARAIKDHVLRHLDSLPGAVRNGLHRRRREGALGARRGRGQQHRHRHHPLARRTRSHQGEDHDLG